MNERIVFTNPDGSCVVLIPTGETSIEHIMEKDIPADAINARLITIDDLPSDRLFRDAWDDSNPENFIGTNLIKAKIIAHNMRRADRETKLSPLDKEQGFASTNKTRKDAIAIEKASILDANELVQIDIDGAADEAALRTVLTAASIY